VAQELYNIPVYNYNLWELPDLVEKFNCITMNAVLEHIRDLDRCLDKISALLSIDGILQIEVPDASRFDDVVGAPFQEFSTEHIDFFSPVSLKNLLQLHGYQQLFCEQNIRQQTDNTMMPVIIAVYKYTGDIDRQIVFDSLTEASLLTYINESRLIAKNLQQTVNNIVADKQVIIVWGVGTHTQRLLAVSNLSKANICAFVDSNPRYQGKFLNGIPIISPAKLTEHDESIMISSQVFQTAIKREIEVNLKLKNQLILLY
jgi:Methyltransferase domain/C-methyltransferase C-terminal domain